MTERHETENRKSGVSIRTTNRLLNLILIIDALALAAFWLYHYYQD